MALAWGLDRGALVGRRDPLGAIIKILCLAGLSWQLSRHDYDDQQRQEKYNNVTN